MSNECTETSDAQYLKVTIQLSSSLATDGIWSANRYSDGRIAAASRRMFALLYSFLYLMISLAIALFDAITFISLEQDTNGSTALRSLSFLLISDTLFIP